MADYFRQPKWRAAKGYMVTEEDGIVRRQEEGICTLHFYHAMSGDSLHLLDRRYEYAVATYGSEIDSRYLYTYDYQPEESWTTYRQDFSEDGFIQRDYRFQESVYFRVALRRRTEGTAGVRPGAEERETQPDLAAILQWRRGQHPETGDTAEPGGMAAHSRAIEGETEATVQSVLANQAEDSLNFLLLTDSHYTVNGTWPDTLYALQRVAAELETRGVKLDGVLHLGDMTDGLVPAEVTRDYVAAVQEDIRTLGVPLYYVLGNHDSNYFRNNPERFSREEIRRVYLQGREKEYYSVDFEEQKIRMVFLDSFDPAEKVRYGFAEEELDWLEDLLKNTSPQWKALIFSHVPPTARLHYWSKEIRGSQRLLQILRRYQAAAGKAEGNIINKERNLLGFIHGHNHADQIDYGEGFPIISVGCNKCEYFEEKKPEGAIAYRRELHTVSQDLWDVLTISAKNGTLDFTRFGAGDDRCISKTGDGDRRIETPMKRVITYGTFDLFHEGHYNILKRARELGDYLIVGVTTEHYDEQRGKLNIVDSLLERIENVRETGFADQIVIEDHEGQKIEDIRKYNVDIFTIGSDWVGTFDYLKPYCQVVYLERTPDISSTMLRKGRFPIIRMGVVGTGRIAPRFIAEAKYVSGLNVQCVYNPHKESADRFAREYFLDSYSDGYENFLDAVDAVYLATPHETHYDYVRRALLRGRHVLCEKPMAFTAEQVRELFALAGERGLVLMEGIKTAYCPGFTQLMNIAMSGKIGEVKDVEACFSRLTDPGLREMVDVRYGGAFLEFGSYTVLPILRLLGTNYEDIRITSLLAENGVDLYTKIYFDYPQGMATSKTGIGVKSEGQLLISGTKGYILAESPWWLTRKFQVRYEDSNKIETYTPNFLGDGLRYEIGEFVSRINGGEGHLFKLTEEESIAMADVVERFMEERSKVRALTRKKNRESGVRIWAHRGASYRYPENTLEAFRAACETDGITGIELDVQLSRDGEIVVFHDEMLDRLMDRGGNLQDYTLEELRSMRFRSWKQAPAAEAPLPRIPSMRETLELIKPYSLEKGIQINIELKNSRMAYEGMEEKLLSLVKEYGMEAFVVYSSFNGGSLKRLKEMDGNIRTGILQSDIRDCLRLMPETGADAAHPNESSMAAGTGEYALPPGTAVRAWNGREPFYGQVRQYVVYDLWELKKRGITDFITNVPEEYLESDGKCGLEKRMGRC